MIAKKSGILRKDGKEEIAVHEKHVLHTWTINNSGSEVFAMQKLLNRTRRRHLAGRGARGAKRPRPPEACPEREREAG